MAPRSTFIARPAYGNTPAPTVGYPIDLKQVRGLVVHHDVIPFDRHAGDVLAEARAHAAHLITARPDLGHDWPYSFGLAPDVADPDHTIIVEGRGFGRSGAHTAGWNSTRYGVVLFGDYRTDRITPGQVRGARWLGAQLFRSQDAAITWGHHDAPGNATECPAMHGEDLVTLAQPPFTAADIAIFQGGPVPSIPVQPGISPIDPASMPGPIVDELDDPDAGGTWVLFEDGSVWTFGTARFFGAPAGTDYWRNENSPARRLIPFRDARGRNRYLVRDAKGHDYGHVGF